MRKLAILAVLGSTALASPAFAKDGAWYVGVEGGGLLAENTNYKVVRTPSAVTIKSKYGWDVDGIVGYDLGMFRIEGEVGYKEANVDRATFAVPNSGVLAGTYNTAYGVTSSLSFMVNGLVDFGAETGLSGYVGGGVGIARTQLKNFSTTNHGPVYLSDRDSGFAYQGIAGVRYPVTDHIDIGAKYRFYTVDHAQEFTRVGTNFNGRIRTHSILASVIYNFGEPPAPRRRLRPRRLLRPRRRLLRPRRRRLRQHLGRSSCSSTGTSR